MAETQETCPLCGRAFDTIYRTRETCDVCGRVVCRACCTRVRNWLDTAGAMEMVCLRCTHEHD